MASKLDEAALAWLYYAKAPVAFCREQLHVELDPWQADVLQHLAMEDVIEVWVSSGHGPGKTFAAACAILWAGCTWVGGIRIPCTAPKESTLLKKLWPETYKILSKAEPAVRNMVEWKKTGMLFRNEPGQEAVPETAREPEGLAGHHDWRVLFVIEEATGIKEPFWPVIRGALSTSGSKLLAISNPTRTSGSFASAFQQPVEGSKLFRIGWHESAAVDRPRIERSETGAVIRGWTSSRQSARWAKSIADTYGRDSNIYRVRVEGLMPLAEDDTLVAPYLVWEAYGRAVNPNDLVLAEKIWSGDIAGAGRDKTILSQRTGPLVQSVVPLPEANLSNAGDSIAEAVKGEQPDRLNLDTIGIGQGVVDRIRAQQVFCNGVNVALPSTWKDDKMGMANLRAEYYWKLRKDFMAGNISIADTVPESMVRQLAEELTATKWFTTPGGKVQIIHKDKIKGEIGRSPDVADCLMLYYATPGAGSIAPQSNQAGILGKSLAAGAGHEITELS